MKSKWKARGHTRGTKNRSASSRSPTVIMLNLRQTLSGGKSHGKKKTKKTSSGMLALHPPARPAVHGIGLWGTRAWIKTCQLKRGQHGPCSPRSPLSAASRSESASLMSTDETHLAQSHGSEHSPARRCRWWRKIPGSIQSIHCFSRGDKPAEQSMMAVSCPSFLQRTNANT